MEFLSTLAELKNGRVIHQANDTMQRLLSAVQKHGGKGKLGVAWPGTRCAGCCEQPGGFEETAYCADCLTSRRIERVRSQPSAGDVITGPNGERVEVTNILECSSGTLVYFTRAVPGKGSQERVMWADKWAALEGWDLARLG